MVTAAISDNGL